MSGAEKKARRRKADADMKMHYRVQSVLLSHNTSALTLSPVEWMRDSETEYVEGDDGPEPAWDSCEPGDKGAQPYEPGGKMTELRIEGPTDLRPDEFLTLTVERTEHDWTPEQ